MIDRIRAAWPVRPVALRTPLGSWRPWGLVVVCLAVAGGVFGFVGYALAPGIIDDFQMRDRARPVAMARLENGRCSSRLALLHSCEATVVATTKEGPVRRPLLQVFADFHMGNWSATVMADPQRAGVFSTDIGLDRIWHRIGTALFFLAIGVVALFAPWGGLRRAAAEKRRLASLSGEALAPVPLGIRGWEGQVVTVVDPRGGDHRWTMPPKASLFALGDGYVLGVAKPGGEAFPLDEKLRWARLTTHERAAIRQARAA
ncbi:MAG: hypothetical protein V4653_12135 [Pseudomonadota bacterium]